MAERSLRRFAAPLVTPQIVFLVCHERLLPVAEELADLLEDACDYIKVRELDDPERQWGSGKAKRRWILMPDVVNRFEQRYKVYAFAQKHNIPVHRFGCIAISGSAAALRSMPPGDPVCAPIVKAERSWLHEDLTCVVTSPEEIDQLKRFVAQALPYFI